MAQTTLESIVGTLPAKVQPYAKTYAAALVTALTVISASLDLPVWVTLALAVANAPVVFAVPNLDPNATKQDESVQPPDTRLTLGDKPDKPVTGWGDGI